MSNTKPKTSKFKAPMRNPTELVVVIGGEKKPCLQFASKVVDLTREN